VKGENANRHAKRMWRTSMQLAAADQVRQQWLKGKGHLLHAPMTSAGYTRYAFTLLIMKTVSCGPSVKQENDLSAAWQSNSRG